MNKKDLTMPKLLMEDRDIKIDWSDCATEAEKDSFKQYLIEKNAFICSFTNKVIEEAIFIHNQGDKLILYDKLWLDKFEVSAKESYRKNILKILQDIGCAFNSPCTPMNPVSYNVPSYTRLSSDICALFQSRSSGSVSHALSTDDDGNPAFFTFDATLDFETREEENTFWLSQVTIGSELTCDLTSFAKVKSHMDQLTTDFRTQLTSNSLFSVDNRPAAQMEAGHTPF